MILQWRDTPKDFPGPIIGPGKSLACLALFGCAAKASSTQSQVVGTSELGLHACTWPEYGQPGRACSWLVKIPGVRARGTTCRFTAHQRALTLMSTTASRDDPGCLSSSQVRLMQFGRRHGWTRWTCVEASKWRPSSVHAPARVTWVKIRRGPKKLPFVFTRIPRLSKMTSNAISWLLHLHSGHMHVDGGIKGDEDHRYWPLSSLSESGRRSASQGCFPSRSRFCRVIVVSAWLAVRLRSSRHGNFPTCQPFSDADTRWNFRRAIPSF